MKTPALDLRMVGRRALLVLVVSTLVPMLLHGSVTGARGVQSREHVCYNVNVVAATHVGTNVVGAPAKIFMDQNYPNPFNPSTVIRFGIPEATHVKLTIHTLVGSRILTLADGWEEAGTYVIDFSAQDLPSGVYFYRLQTELGTITRRMTVAK